MDQELTPPAAPAIDVEATVADIAESLHLAEAPKAEEPAPAEPAATEPAAEPAAVATEGGTAPSEEGAAKPEGEAATAPADDDKIPSTWRKEAKDAWAGLPQVVKDEVAKRESDIARHVSETNLAVKVAKGFEKITEPYMPLFQKYGVNPWNHVSTLLEAHHKLLFGAPEVKQGMFVQLAKDAGIDLAALAAGTPQAENPLLSHVRGLQARIAELERGVGNVTSTVQEARVAELSQTVMEFGNDPKHPFFWELADEVKALIDSGASTTLNDAYEIAVARNPQTRQKLIDQELAARRKTEDEANAQHVEKAKKAMGGMPKAAGKGRATSAPETVDDTLKKTLAKINARESA